MANTLTSLQPVLFSAAQTVSAEPFGIIGGITTSFDDKGVAKGDNVVVPIAPTRAASDFTPAAVSSSGTDATAANVNVTITKSRKVDWNLTGEQIRSLENSDSNTEWIRQLVAQGMRTLRNEAEVDAALAIKYGASRAYGTAGTTPFASDLSALTNARKILRDNGAPMADLQMWVDTSAELNLLNLGIIQQAYQAGSDSERRSGKLLPQFGATIGASAGIASHTKGAATGALINGAEAAAQTTLTLDTITVNTTGILAGDVVTFAGDTNKYVVNTGLVATAGDIVIGRPGLKAAAADNTAMTIGNTYTPNLLFERSAVVGVMRPPLFPQNANITQVLVSDGMGMTYLMLDISQYGQRTWELHLAWGFKVVQSEHVALILG